VLAEPVKNMKIGAAESSLDCDINEATARFASLSVTMYVRAKIDKKTFTS